MDERRDGPRWLCDDDDDDSTESYSIKLGVYNTGGNHFVSVKVKVGTDTAKSADVMVAGFRQCGDLIRKGKMFVKYEAKVASRLSSVY